MKTFSVKYIRYTTGLVLLAGIITLAGCDNLLVSKPGNSGGDAGGRGYGLLTVTLGDHAARTLYPADTGFQSYIISFSHGSRSHADETFAPGDTIAVALDTDAAPWTITVTAYTGAGGSGTAAASGTASITMDGSAQTANITLAPIPGGGTGTFSYSISFPATISSAALTITTAAGGAVTGGTITANFSQISAGTLNGTLSLDAGYYFMNLNLVKGTLGAGKTEVLHIYPGLTTEANYTFTDADLRTTLRCLLDGLGASGGTLTLDNDYSLDPYTIGAGKTITLQGDGTERTVTLTGAGRLFTLYYGGKLILGNNVTLKGHDANNECLVYVIGTGSELTMNVGSKITGNTAPVGGGVRVDGGSSFTMNGGEISDNTTSSSGGGGVYVYNGDFSMSGGEISGNTASSGGGVYVYNGDFSMSGGEISGNTASSFGGGVCVAVGSFTINDGKISGNTASFGGGVCVDGDSFTMNGGEISGNTASSGGGVCVYNGDFSMSGGEISGNIASSDGGGVYVSGGDFSMSGGEISGNTASSSGGGGVYVPGGDFSMSGGEISGNTASSFGGGVYVPGGDFSMSGGEISGNTASSSGGGVHVRGVSGTFTFRKQPASGSTTSGVIYGYTAGDNRSNKVVSTGTVQTNRGSAVSVEGYNESSYIVTFTSVQRRETTAGQTDYLDSTQSGSAGGWE
ncbi:hypothetical protein ACYULU_13285 [Breznakiellaceae bacterium SP9]